MLTEKPVRRDSWRGRVTRAGRPGTLGLLALDRVFPPLLLCHSPGGGGSTSSTRGGGQVPEACRLDTMCELNTSHCPQHPRLHALC